MCSSARERARTWLATPKPSLCLRELKSRKRETRDGSCLKKGESSPGPKDSRVTVQRSESDASAPLICAEKHVRGGARQGNARVASDQLPHAREPKVLGSKCNV